MNLLKPEWSDENIRFQNRQKDFYLTGGGYKLKNQYLKSLKSLETLDDDPLLKCICSDGNRKILIDNYDTILDGSSGNEYRGLNNFLYSNRKDRLDRIEKDRSNIIRCIHNSMIKRHITSGRSINDCFTSTEENSNMLNNSNCNSDKNDFIDFNKSYSSKCQHNLPKHPSLNLQNFQEEIKRDKNTLKINKSNNHNNENCSGDDLNAYFMSQNYPQLPNFSPNQPIFTANPHAFTINPPGFSTNHPVYTANCKSLLSNPRDPEAGLSFSIPSFKEHQKQHFSQPFCAQQHFCQQEYSCPRPHSPQANELSSMDCGTKKGNFFNNLSFLMSRFRARYADDSRDSECGSSKGILRYLYNNFLNQENCDFIVKTKNGDVMAHQLVVASFSPSVDNYLKSQKKKIQQPLMVNLEDCSLDAVTSVLNFLYTTDITLNSLNIGFIANVSVRLDLPVLNHVSNDYLIQTLDTDNAFLHLSVSINNKFLSAVHIFKFIALNFFELIEHEHLLLLPFENFYTLVTHPSLRAKEVEVFVSIANWMNFNRPSRMKHSKCLLSLIKFHLIDPQQLAKYVEHQEWIFNDEENKRIILDAYKYHALNKARNESAKFE